MESNKETLKKKISALCVVAACSQFIEDNRKHSRVSNTRKRKCWVKLWLTEKLNSLHHGLVSELLLQGKEEFKKFLRTNMRRTKLVSLC